MQHETSTAAGVPAPLNRTPGHLIRRAQQIAVSIFLAECRQPPVTPIQYAILKVLSGEAGLDQISLAHKVALDRSTLADVAKRLEAKGLLIRAASPNDRRQKLLSLSDQGRAVLQAVEPAVERTQDRILAPLTPEERHSFLGLLNKLVDNNNEISRAPYKEYA